MWWKSDSARSQRPPQPGEVVDHRTTPAGVVPRHLQQWTLIGIAVVMVGILSLSGPTSKAPSSSVLQPGAATVDPNRQRIEEYQRHLQEQAQRLAAEQTQLQLAKDNAAVLAQSRAMPAAAPAGERPPAAGSSGIASKSADRSTREEHARFADNVAFSRPAPVAPVATPSSPGSATASSTGTQGAPPTSLQPATPPRYRLEEGTFIDTVLTNRLDGTFPGPVNCLVSVPVYATDQQHLVIPAGARVLGEARAVSTFGQARLAVVFHRVILPNGVHIVLDNFHGLNQAGDLGLQDQVDRHYAQIFGVSLAIGAIAGFAQLNTSVGFEATAMDAYRQGMAANVAQSSARILDRFLNILPTVTIREGHRIKVYLANDLELPEYRESSATGGRP